MKIFKIDLKNIAEYVIYSAKYYNELCNKKYMRPIFNENDKNYTNIHKLEIVSLI